MQSRELSLLGGAPMTEVCCHTTSQPGRKLAAALRSPLAAAGVRMVGGPPDQPGSYTAHLVIGDEDAALVERLSHHGMQRVIVLVPPESDDHRPPGPAWLMLQAGASDVVSMSAPETLAPALAARFRRWAVIDEVLDSALVRDNLVGDSAAWRGALRHLIEATVFGSGPILILGETGTGKELAARLIHALNRADNGGELIIVDCTTLSPDLSGSELFGHERGAYTGAVAARDGALALANGGTLFLDEVGELPGDLQARLLRAVQERAYKKVGSNRWEHSDFRLVAATNRDLSAAVDDGTFRSDLYHRMAGWIVRLPPLRRRREDIEPLARHFLSRATGREPDLEPSVRAFLLSRDYPGNVRDLQRLIERIATRDVAEGPVTLGQIPKEEWPGVEEHGAADLMRDAVRACLTAGCGLRDVTAMAGEAAVGIAMEQSAGCVQGAANRLRVSTRALHQRRARRNMTAAGPLGALILEPPTRDPSLSTH